MVGRRCPACRAIAKAGSDCEDEPSSNDGLSTQRSSRDSIVSKEEFSLDMVQESPAPRCRRHRRQRAAWRAAGYAIVFAAVTLSLMAVNMLARPRSSNTDRLAARSFDDFLYSDLDHPSLENASCGNFHSWNDTCYFVKHASECAVDGGFINYLELPYCVFHSEPGAIVLLLLWLVFLFIALGVTAEDYFCPALSVISDTLRLSHNVAGVTFLAFGNGAPDIFSVYSSINNAKNGVQLALGALFGAGTFVTTVVVGTVSFYYPFTLTRRPFLRDVATYLIATTWTYVVLWREEITTAQAIGFCAVYVVYVLVVIVGRHIYQSRKARRTNPVEEKKQEARKEEMKVHSREQSDEEQQPEEQPLHLQPQHHNHQPQHHNHQPQHHHHPPHSLAEAFDVAESIGIATALGHDIEASHHTPATAHVGINAEEEAAHLQEESETDHREDEGSGYGDEEPLLASRTELEPPEPAWSQFFNALIPFSKEDFVDAGLLGKIYMVLSVPITLALTITTPVVDFDEEDEHWVQYLSMLQCVVAPVFFVFGVGFGDTTIGDVYPVWLLAMMIGGVFALIIWATSRARQPPRFHFVFAFMGFAVAVIWIYIVANEIVNLLQTLGRMFGISDAILGLTVLSWGNSIGDFVSNLTVARQGYPRMAVGAAFGGPALNMLLGIGISCTIACLNHGGRFPVKDQPSHQLAVSGGFLLLSLVSSMVIIPLRKFNASRKYGIYLWVLYACYLASALALEFTGSS